VAAILTWIVPAGQYDRRTDPVTGRQVVVPGTFHPTGRAPVGPFAAAVAIPRGFVAGADVIFLVLLVGGAWVVVDRLGTLPAVVGWLVDRFGDGGLLVIPIVAIFFGTMGALENMLEEVIPLVPVLMVLGAGIGVDGITVVAMSLGAAMVGSTFGPTNPFQAGIALKLAQLPPLGRGGLRLATLIAGLTVWIVLTVVHARRFRRTGRRIHLPTDPHVRITAETAGEKRETMNARHALILAIIVSPFAAYVYGALRLDWGLNELSGAFLIAGLLAGVVGGFGVTKTVTTYLDGMMSLLTAACMVGIARSISLVLDDGRVVDTILHALVTPLARFPSFVAVLLMMPFQALLHIPVPSVSGQAVLTMPLFAPIADLLGFSREAVVIAYQIGAGLMEMVTPTNGALMAVLLAAGVPLQRWLRFAAVGIVLLVTIGVVAAALAM